MFFVAKKNGSLRIVFDTRLANFSFKAPLSCELPTAHSMARIEMTGKSANFLAVGDIENAFYEIRIPSGLSEFFSLPGIRAGLLGLDSLDGCNLEPTDWIEPQLVVLPMGWSWALLLCQLVR